MQPMRFFIDTHDRTKNTFPAGLGAEDFEAFFAKFEQEVLQTLDQRLLQFVLGVFVFQAEEFKHERVPDVFVRRELIARILPCREVPPGSPGAPALFWDDD